MVRLFRPDAVWDLSDAGIGTFEGATAIRRFVEDWQSSYEDYEVAVEEIVDFGKGVTLGVSVQTGRPTGSSGEVQIRFASILIFEDGLIVWMKNYNEIDENRVAAGRLAASRA
jgi:ketosteroid isomerase-like protein